MCSCQPSVLHSNPRLPRCCFAALASWEKEVVLELQRYGIEVIAADAYPDAPAMQVADRAHVFPMLDGERLRAVVEKERPDLIIPEVEAIATDTLVAIESEGLATVIPTARATRLTMNREGIRRLAAEELKLETSPYRFAETREEYDAALEEIGLPCVIKPIMSSSGKGQSTVKSEADIDHAWDYAQSGGRAGAGKVIVEGFVEFDYEITQLTVRHAGGTSFCEPIGHIQIDGDYRESWQPQSMSDTARAEAQRVAEAITSNLGGRGVFGVELFVKGDTIIFSEVSPRPHDTGDGDYDFTGFVAVSPSTPERYSAFRFLTLCNTDPLPAASSWLKASPTMSSSAILEKPSLSLTLNSVSLANRGSKESVAWAWLSLGVQIQTTPVTTHESARAPSPLASSLGTVYETSSASEGGLDTTFRPSRRLWLSVPADKLPAHLLLVTQGQTGSSLPPMRRPARFPSNRSGSVTTRP